MAFSRDDQPSPTRPLGFFMFPEFTFQRDSFAMSLCLGPLIMLGNDGSFQDRIGNFAADRGDQADEANGICEKAWC